MNKKYFYGNEISEYGIEHNRVDYRALAKSFDAVLCNDITKLFYSDINGEYNEVEQINGFIDNSEIIEELEINGGNNHGYHSSRRIGSQRKDRLRYDGLQACAYSI